MIDNLTLQRIKDSASIVETIGDFCELRRKGATYQGLCPFHGDRHLGSFIVNPRHNTFCCYSCGERGDSIEFLMKHERMSFIDAVKWLGRKYGIQVGDEPEREYKQPTVCRPRQREAALPAIEIPQSYIKSCAARGENALTRWVRSLDWDTAQRSRVDGMLRNYLIGTSADGLTIFWQVDETGRVRTGKMMRYKDDGHRDHTTPRSFDWVHSRLIRAGYIDADKCELSQCLFGLHLLDFAGPRTVNIVESEKTALLCAIASGGMKEQLWMASGGKSLLTRNKLQPIIDRGIHITLYPDKDATEEWRQIAAIIGYKKLNINAEFHWEEEDGDKWDVGDTIVKMLGRRKAYMDARGKKLDATAEEILADMASANPVIAKMIKEFELRPIH